mgnify:CR=1 FL=1
MHMQVIRLKPHLCIQVFRFKPHLFLPFVSRLVRHPSILDIVQNALGTENLILWSSDWNIKQQRSDGHYTAHQDATFTGLVPP